MKKAFSLTLVLLFVSLLCIPGTSGESNKVLVTMQIGNKLAYVNGLQVSLDIPPQIINGRTLVPIRFVSENLGAKVGWDSNMKTVTITMDSITYLNSQIDDLHRQIGDKDNTISILNHTISTLNNQLKDKDNTISILNEQLKDNTTISTLNNQLKDKDNTISILNERLKDKDALIDSLNEQIDGLNKQISNGTEGWKKVIEFTGTDWGSTSYFTIHSKEWKIVYSAQETYRPCVDCGGTFYFLIYIGNVVNNTSVKESFKGKINNEMYIHEGNDEFHLWVFPSNCKYTMTVYEHQ